jgi:DNA invertase Pin-like site-specific DNA recombinase
LYRYTFLLRYSSSVRAVTYRAVSADAQAVSGLALDAQQEELDAAVEARGWRLVAPLIDGAASVELAPADRLALSEAFTILRNHDADVLMVPGFDHVCRSVGDLLDLLGLAERSEFGIVALDSGVDTTVPGSRRTAVAVAGVLAAWHRRTIAERTRAALSAKKAGGGRLGRPIQLPQELRHRVDELRLQGRSIAKVADALNQEGRTQGNGAPWTRSAVQRVLRSLQLDQMASDAAGPLRSGEAGRWPDSADTPPTPEGTSLRHLVSSPRTTERWGRTGST